MHDFVNYKTSLPVESFDIESPEGWSLDFNSMAVGLVLGVCACLIYLNIAQAHQVNAAAEPATNTTEAGTDNIFEFEFYQALKAYEVEPRYLPD